MTSAATPYAEVIGDPVEHSKSPLIHGFWLEKSRIEADYRATRVARADFPAYLAGRRADPLWRGCNVTMPLKLDAAALADETTDRAVAAGAANLLLPVEGRIVAANTDVGAVVRLLGPRLSAGMGGAITLLGNGGAARAVLVALRSMGVDDVRIQARDLSEAYRLAVEFRLTEEPCPFDQSIDTEGLINTTPVGMTGTAPIAIDITAMPPRGWVFDLVTAPPVTPLLADAAARGLTTIDGVAMLVEQAADSFALLFGRDAPRQLDDALLAELRS